MSPRPASRRAPSTALRIVPFVTAYAAALTAALLLSACGGGSTSTVEPPLTPTAVEFSGSDVTLAPGGSVVIDATGLRLTFGGVTNESRCPTNALILCVWEGSARIALRVSSAAGQRDVALETFAPRDTITVDRYLVRLVRVTPAPVTTDPIPAASYRATLRIENK